MHDGGAFHSISHVEILVSIWWNCDRHNCSAQVSFDLVLDCQNVGSSPGLPHQCMEEEDMYFSGESSDEHPIAQGAVLLPLKESLGAGTLKCVFVAHVGLAGTPLTQSMTTLTLPHHYGRLRM